VHGAVTTTDKQLVEVKSKLEELYLASDDNEETSTKKAKAKSLEQLEEQLEVELEGLKSSRALLDELLPKAQEDAVAKSAAKSQDNSTSVMFGNMNSGQQSRVIHGGVHGADPPTTIEEAVECRNFDVLRQLLRKEFETAAKGKYSWILELDELGYTRDEIAEIIFEQANDAPWIYFAPTTFHTAPPLIGVHLPGCVHQFLPSNPNSASQSSVLGSLPEIWRSIAKIVEELCGLAGIAPTTRDMEKWDGSVMFTERNSMATVTYSRISGKLDMEHREMISRLHNSLRRFCLAAGHAQAAKLCCDSFTVLFLPSKKDTDQTYPAEPSIEVCQIGFDLPLQMLSELIDLSTVNVISPTAISKIRQTASQILRPLFQGTTTLHYDSSVGAGLQLCSLAIQVVCVGFLSYAQAHAGPIKPFFLDTPLEKIRLLGSRVSTDDHPWVEASLENLTCMDEMIQSRVIAFSLKQPHIPHSPSSGTLRYNLETNAHDLLDTWGPGRFLIQPTNNALFAIQIGDGVIYASSINSRKFHWSKDMGFEPLSQISLDPLSKMVIGGPVIVNEHCRNDVKRCREKSSTSLEHLGTYRAFWESDERQIGVQAGNYVMLHAIAASHKLPGLTLKQYRLQQEDDLLISFLDELWGVQVSFCTHVARRVALREVVADLLSVFAASSIFSNHETRLWEELLKLGIIEAFQHNKIRDLLITLSSQLYQLTLRMVRRVLEGLRHTGLDRQRKNILIAWPHESDTSRCFSVACEKESSWVGVLADSEDSATFAYITTRCFETEKIKCNGPNPTWQGKMPFLETAVVPHARDPCLLETLLQDNATYFFQKLDHLFFVKVQKPDSTCVANLITSRSRLPPDIQRRLLVKFMEDRRRQARLREKIAEHDFAENVTICY
jgi:hypothetical protein